MKKYSFYVLDGTPQEEIDRRLEEGLMILKKAHGAEEFSSYEVKIRRIKWPVSIMIQDKPVTVEKGLLYEQIAIVK